jgi:excinuclease ABC subunit A
VKVFSTKRACPVCGTSYPELDPRMFSYNSKHGWCTSCVGTGLALTREQRKAYDDTVRDDDDKGREQSFPSRSRGRGPGRRSLPRCHGTRLNAASRGVTFDGRADHRHRALSVQRGARWVEALHAGRPRRRHRARRGGEIRSRLEFLETWAWAT